MKVTALFEALCAARGPDAMLDHHLQCLRDGYDSIELQNDSTGTRYYASKDGLVVELTPRNILEFTKFATDAMTLIPSEYKGRWHCGRDDRGRMVARIGQGPLITGATLPLAICLAFVFMKMQMAEATNGAKIF